MYKHTHRLCFKNELTTFLDKMYLKGGFKLDGHQFSSTRVLRSDYEQMHAFMFYSSEHYNFNNMMGCISI